MADSWPAPKPALTVTRAILLDGFPTGTKVYTEMPSTRPDEFIVVGMASALYPNPAFTVPRPLIEFWAKTSARAEEMCCQGIRVMRNAKGEFAGAWVKGMHDIQGPIPLNDPDIQDRRRSQMHGDLYLATR